MIKKIWLISFVLVLIFSYHYFTAGKLKCTRQHQSDKDMIYFFNKNHNKFEEILDLLRIDKRLDIVEVDSDGNFFTVPDKVINEDRFNIYTSALSDINICRLTIYRDEGRPRVDFDYSNSGWISRWAKKGYAYIPYIDKTSLNIVESLDKFTEISGAPDTYSKRYLRKISDDWYLYFVAG